ncbi:MAG: sugar ABC transporter permease [Tenericutes bacterium]|nr:sugar ABC transporter permease [Mycoplasmatota bacterium]
MKSKLHKKETKWAVIFILMPLIGFLVFTLLSLIFSGYFSLTNYNPIRIDWKFIGLQNYIKLFKDQYFLQAIFNTFFFMLSIPFSMLFGLLLAVFINMGFKGNKTFRVMYYLPAVSSAVAINIVWRYIFNGESGILNYALGLSTQWLGNGDWPIKFAIIIKAIWSSVGMTMILYLAGLQNVPKSLYEAADIDGASSNQKFRMITVPILSPVTFYVLITSMIGTLQSFVDSQIFAEGNPAARTIVYYIWSKGIDQNRYGIASAASIILAVSIMILTIIQFRRSRKWVFEQ